MTQYVFLGNAIQVIALFLWVISAFISLVTFMSFESSWTSEWKLWLKWLIVLSGFYFAAGCAYWLTVAIHAFLSYWNSLPGGWPGVGAQ